MNKQALLQSLKHQGFEKKILNAFKKVERKKFISKEFHKYAYEDGPLPIGAGQTISQPYTIAFMLDLLELKDNQKILEVGSGSGYVLALINKISKNSQIYGIERIKGLANKSKRTLKNKKNIEIIYGDGSRGLSKASLLDRILISASADELPQKLIKQLKLGGILVAPVGNSIIYLKKTKGKNKIIYFPGFRFVPLIED